MGWLLVTGIAVLMTLAVGPALAGSASAAPTPAGLTASASTQWAYGGQGNVTGSATYGAGTLSWNATFGWTVIFTQTNTSNTTVELEEQRTVGIAVTTTYTAPNVSATYAYHATENDTAFANITDAATVYVSGQATPALGIDNASIAVRASVDQSIVEQVHDFSRSGWLNVTGAAQGGVAFTPALGLIPLNLSGVSEWNSSAEATPHASWNINYAWADLGWNGTTRSGSGSDNGTWMVSGPVSVTGYQVVVTHTWTDYKPRTAVILIVQGPVDAYDGFVLVPHGFDLFGGASHSYDGYALGTASVGYGSSETLFVSNGARGPQVTAAQTTFGAGFGADATLGEATSGPSSASAASPSTTVTGSPMTVPQAQAEAACLSNGCSGGAAPAASTVGLLGIAVIALAVVAVVGTVSVIEWRSYARRRNQKGLVGGYGEGWTDGVPPAGSAPPTAVQGPTVPDAPRPPQP